MTEKALTARIVRRQKEKSVIDKPGTETAVQTLARLFRDSALLFTDKFYTQIAAELGYEENFKLYQVLDKYIRKNVEDNIDSIKVAIES